MKNKKMYYGLGVAALALLMVIMFIKPVNSLTMDVNPSIEIVTNRLERVVEINPLNKDARKLLEGFELEDRNLENTVNDLVDLMILTGHIKGGQDNFVMLTVEDDSVESKFVDKVNNAIAAMLENKQIEATLLNQSIDSQQKESGQTGVQIVAERLKQGDSRLSMEEIENMSVRELVKYANENDIVIENLFKVVDGRLAENKDLNEKNQADSEKQEQTNSGKISGTEAKNIALKLTGGGNITEFELDDDKYEIEVKTSSHEYEIDINAYTGEVKDYDKEELEIEKNQASSEKQEQTNSGKISGEEAKKIALNLTGGGNITEFELDDDKYEIEVKTSSHEYEIDISSYDGQIVDFEKDSLDD